MEAESRCSPELEVDLTEEQLKRIHRNKGKALALRKQRRKAKPYDGPSKKTDSTVTLASSTPNPPMQQPLSSRSYHAGFIIDDDDDSSGRMHSYQRLEEEAPALPDDLMTCEECTKLFAESYLHGQFHLHVCDKCRDSSGKHSMITKTDAKQKFLLQDYHFEEPMEGPALPYLLKKNPHSSLWGEMKLYLLCQVEARSHEVWGNEEGLEREREMRKERREKKKEKKYAKEIKALRKAVRVGNTQVVGGKSHVHDFPPNAEKYDAYMDSWTKTCSLCGFQVTFEKM